MKQVEQRPGGGRARPAAESGEVQGEDVDFDLDGPLNSGPRSNITFLPALLDLYAGQHRAWHSPFALLCGTDTPPSGHFMRFSAPSASLRVDVSFMKAETTCVFRSVPRVWFPVGASSACAKCQNCS